VQQVNQLFDAITFALRSTLQFFFGFTHDYTFAIVLLNLLPISYFVPNSHKF